MASDDPEPVSGVRDADTYPFVVAGSYWPPPPPDASWVARVPRPAVISVDPVAGARVCHPVRPSTYARMFPALFCANHCVDTEAGAELGHCHRASSPTSQ